MAFGGTFNPFQQYSQPAPMQMPMQPSMQPPRPGLGDMKTQFAPTQQGYGNADPMALYSLYGLLGTGQKTGEAGSIKPLPLANAPTPPPTAPTPPPTVPVTQPPAASAGSRVVPGTPQPLVPGAPAGGTAVSKPGFTPPPSGPSAGSRVVPGTPPNSGSVGVPDVDSYSGSPYDQQMAQYNSPEYAAYYNSLAPSTRAFMHAPGNQQTGQYLAQQWQDSYNAFNGNPWAPRG